MMWRINKPTTFVVREKTDHGLRLWQVGQDVTSDASFYCRDLAIRFFDKLVKRHLVPVFEENATDPHLAKDETN